MTTITNIANEIIALDDTVADAINSATGRTDELKSVLGTGGVQVDEIQTSFNDLVLLSDFLEKQVPVRNLLPDNGCFVFLSHLHGKFKSRTIDKTPEFIGPISNKAGMFLEFEIDDLEGVLEPVPGGYEDLNIDFDSRMVITEAPTEIYDEKIDEYVEGWKTGNSGSFPYFTIPDFNFTDDSTLIGASSVEGSRRINDTVPYFYPINPVTGQFRMWRVEFSGLWGDSIRMTRKFITVEEELYIPEEVFPGHGQLISGGYAESFFQRLDSFTLCNETIPFGSSTSIGTPKVPMAFLDVKVVDHGDPVTPTPSYFRTKASHLPNGHAAYEIYSLWVFLKAGDVSLGAPAGINYTYWLNGNEVPHGTQPTMNEWTLLSIRCDDAGLSDTKITEVHGAFGSNCVFTSAYLTEDSWVPSTSFRPFFTTDAINPLPFSVPFGDFVNGTFASQRYFRRYDGFNGYELDEPFTHRRTINDNDFNDPNALNGNHGRQKNTILRLEIGGVQVDVEEEHKLFDPLHADNNTSFGITLLGGTGSGSFNDHSQFYNPLSDGGDQHKMVPANDGRLFTSFEGSNAVPDGITYPNYPNRVEDATQSWDFPPRLKYGALWTLLCDDIRYITSSATINTIGNVDHSAPGWGYTVASQLPPNYLNGTGGVPLRGHGWVGYIGRMILGYSASMFRWAQHHNDEETMPEYSHILEEVEGGRILNHVTGALYEDAWVNGPQPVIEPHFEVETWTGERGSYARKDQPVGFEFSGFNQDLAPTFVGDVNSGSCILRGISGSNGYGNPGNIERRPLGSPHPDYYSYKDAVHYTHAVLTANGVGEVGEFDILGFTADEDNMVLIEMIYATDSAADDVVHVIPPSTSNDVILSTPETMHNAAHPLWVFGDSERSSQLNDRGVLNRLRPDHADGFHKDVGLDDIRIEPGAYDNTSNGENITIKQPHWNLTTADGSLNVPLENTNGKFKTIRFFVFREPTAIGNYTPVDKTIVINSLAAHATNIAIAAIKGYHGVANMLEHNTA